MSDGTEMTEAHLREYEKGTHGISIDELIAAVRAAWNAHANDLERDGKRILKEFRRAERVEAQVTALQEEVERLKHPKLTATEIVMAEEARRVCLLLERRIKALQAVREAAGTLIPWGDGIEASHPAFPKDDRLISFEKLLRLRRALDAYAAVEKPGK